MPFSNPSSVCFTLADALLGIETDFQPLMECMSDCFTLADALLGIETEVTFLSNSDCDVSLWLMPF